MNIKKDRGSDRSRVWLSPIMLLSLCRRWALLPCRIVSVVRLPRPSTHNYVQHLFLREKKFCITMLPEF